jgi:hypothetical protein
VLLGLSVFAAGFTREATEQVAGASLPVLMGMVDRMLIRRTDDQRFAMHEMIRQFLAKRRKQSPEAAAIESTYVQYFVKFMQQRETTLNTALQNHAVRVMSVNFCKKGRRALPF